MNTSEHSIQTDILKLSTGQIRLFRNNNGIGWAGQPVEHRGDVAIVHHSRPLHAGLIKGSGDLIGWKTVTITPDMIGQRIAQFVSIEVKAAHGKPTPDQETWRDNVRAAGGIGCVARSKDEASHALGLDLP